MRPDQEPWDVQLGQAKRAYHELGPSDVQLDRMLRAIEAPALSPAGGTAAGMKLVKIVVVTLGVLALGLWVGQNEVTPLPPPPLPAVPRVEPLPTPSERPTASERAPSEEAPPPPQEVGEPILDMPKPSASKRRTRVAEREPSARGGTTDLTSELALLSRARRILPRDPERALVLAETHARDYPRGVFAEERELLAVQALLAADRRTEAERRALRFERVHPGSVHAHRMQVLLESPAD